MTEEKYQSEDFVRGRVSVLRDFHNMCAADAFMGFTDAEWSAIKKFFKFNEALTQYSDSWEHEPLPRTKVVVEVYGGVAECTSKPEDVEVVVIDHDNE